MTLAIGVSYGVCLYILARAMRSPVIRFLYSHNVTDCNYKRQRIPSASGVLIWLVFLLNLFAVTIWQAASSLFLSAASTFLAEWPGLAQMQELGITLFTALTVVCVLGWTDDLIGNRAIKGLRGHLAAWLQKREITTGLLKAVGTMLAALWFSLQAGLWESGILIGATSCLLISLSTNTLNLLDLRPGRAMKMFLFSALVTVSCALSLRDAILMLIPAVAGVCALLPLDLKGQSMLGDTGANTLGFVLGAALAFTWAWHYQLIALFILAGLNILAEKYSLTQLIERVPMLRWLDRLGRNQPS